MPRAQYWRALGTGWTVAEPTAQTRAMRHCRGGCEEPLANIIGRFRCRCGRKSVEVQIGFDRKPRGWVKNPA